MDTDSEKGNTTRSALARLAQALLRHYEVIDPPVPVEQMLQEPPPGLSRVDPSRISFILEHGLYCYEPRLSMARLLCREIVRNRAVQQSLGVDVPSFSYVDLKFFARCLLMPTDWVRKMAKQELSVEQIGASLETPAHAVVTRLAELGLPVSDTE